MESKNKTQKLDILHGPIWNKLPLYALPVAATGILEQLFNASDLAIVGNFASTDRTVAIAAVGANSPVIGVILNLFIGISLGTNVIIANAIGRKDKKAVEQAVHTSVLAALIGGLLVTLLGELFIGNILNMLNVPEDVFPYALLYIRIYLIGLPVIFLYNFEAAIFRSTGDTKVPLQALAFAGVLNVLLNLLFVIVFKMSVNGVAIATVVSNLTSSLILLVRLTRTQKWIRVQLSELRIHKDCLLKILRIGLPAGIQSAVFNIANVVIQSAINSLGTVVIAASSAAYNIEILAYYVLNSFSQACTTFVGQNYGAKQISRCKKVFALSLVEDLIASASSILLILASGKFLLSLFNSDPQVIEIGYTRLLIIFSAYTFSMLYEVMSGYLRGFGISFVPAILTTIGVCGTRLAWVFTVFPHHRNFASLMLVYPVSLATTAVLIFIALMVYRPARKFRELEK
ncbi:MATE family efflux transporter [Blautia sp. MSJ-19]|uniref:MATE family efflux transporter n=1 Tax=Blautia sp. MSJ-19 TaxID=2841517 RepID=UPI001C0F01A9|nr:MATE family efflux transporter [Blautia sp. MSJ-19]MBU5480288.1 MATE family efflux transporter [Blautia sp. MSJ-19]